VAKDKAPKVALFGAAGNLGTVLLRHLLDGGYEVHALVRHAPPQDSEQITYTTGNALEYDDALAMIRGCEAVIDVLGGDEHSTVRSEFITNIIKAMREARVRRIIAMGGSGILRVGPWTFSQLPVFPADKRDVTRDHERVYQLLAQSGLLWTQVCPSIMEAGPALGKYKVRIGHPFLLWKQTVRLEDVADFIIRELDGNRYVYKQVALIN
jgi:putative NADH-flavin reductase